MFLQPQKKQGLKASLQCPSQCSLLLGSYRNRGPKHTRLLPFSSAKNSGKVLSDSISRPSAPCGGVLSKGASHGRRKVCKTVS